MSYNAESRNRSEWAPMQPFYFTDIGMCSVVSPDMVFNDKVYLFNDYLLPAALLTMPIYCQVDVSDFDGAPEIPEEMRGGGGSGEKTVRRHRGLRMLVDTEVRISKQTSYSFFMHCSISYVSFPRRTTRTSRMFRATG